MDIVLRVFAVWIIGFEKEQAKPRNEYTHLFYRPFQNFPKVSGPHSFVETRENISENQINVLKGRFLLINGCYLLEQLYSPIF